MVRFDERVTRFPKNIKLIDQSGNASVSQTQQMTHSFQADP